MNINATIKKAANTAKPANFIIKVIEDRKVIVEKLKSGEKLSSITGIKIVSPQ